MPRLRGVSHLVAFIFAVAAAIVAIALAPTGHSAAAAAIYGAGLVGLFGVSALYHRWPGPERFKPLLRRLDHSTIYLFIAASYTPVALIVLHGTLAWVILGLAWAGAGAGIALSLGWIDAPRHLKAGSYVALGWLAVLALPQLLAHLPLTPLLLVAGGGVVYSVGAVIFALRRPDPWPRTFGFHEIFHALVILAASAYYVALVGWMLPTTA
ncbi:MAG: hemolysin III family protein [Solirubrobacteraceae bacterium]